ncbi:MAG: molybdate ABC transporter substrate-binding protein [Chloroflexota bacterium]|nr:molybdate ABC transporter substrate-binding protein [Chloroflexota bacterium]
MGTSAAEFPLEGGSLTVFAAASLTDAFGRIEADLEAANDGLDIAYNFAGSQALVTQLQEGAEADVFASANAAQMEAAVDNGSIVGEPVTFVRNRLAIVVPADNPAGIEAPADLADDGIQVVLAQPDVPVGRYARESLCLMGQDETAFDDGFVDRVVGNVVSEEEDVRDVLARVQLGEADAGIVYVSDAATAGEAVRLIEIPNARNVVAAYPIALVEGSDEALGSAFVSYLVSPAGQATLEEFGFEPINE